MSLNPRKPFPSFLLILCLLVASQYPSTNGSSQNHTTFIFQHCSTEKLDDPNGEYTNARSTLLQRLVVQAARSNFNRSFVMVESRSAGSVSGLFQCRGDLDDRKCNECMRAAQNVSSGLCGNSMAGRIQLSGCHVEYEADEYENSSPSEGLNHKICGEPLVGVESEQFEEVRSKAFEALEDEVANEGDHVLGFYSIKQEGVHALAQCEVGIGGCDCAKCVVDAIHVVEEECEASISAQVFMELCYLSFEFNPHGGVNPHEIPHGGATLPPPEKKGFGGKGKLVALAVGGAFVLAMAFMCCRFFKKKDDDDL